MPKTHRNTYLIVENKNRLHLHSGVSALFAIIRLNICILERVRQAFSFQNCGCDCAGPIILKVNKGRDPRKEKGLDSIVW